MFAGLAFVLLLLTTAAVIVLTRSDSGDQLPDPEEIAEYRFKAGEQAKVGSTVVTDQQIDDESRLMQRLQGCKLLNGAACRRARQKMRKDIAGALIEQGWILQEAERMGVKPTRAELAASRQALVANGFWSKMTEAEREKALKINALQRQIKQPAHDSVKDPTEEQLRAAWQAEYVTPQQRTYRVFAGASRVKAAQAVRAVKRGMSWVQANKRYGNHLGLTTVGARTEPGSGLLPAGLESAVGRARDGQRIGPVNIAGRWWIVQAHVKGGVTRMPYEKARAKVKDALLNQLHANAELRQQVQFIRRWRPRTRCTPTLNVALCANGPQHPLLSFSEQTRTKR